MTGLWLFLYTSDKIPESPKIRKSENCLTRAPLLDNYRISRRTFATVCPTDNIQRLHATRQMLPPSRWKALRDVTRYRVPLNYWQNLFSLHHASIERVCHA